MRARRCFEILAKWPVSIQRTIEYALDKGGFSAFPAGEDHPGRGKLPGDVVDPLMEFSNSFTRRLANEAAEAQNRVFPILMNGLWNVPRMAEAFDAARELAAAHQDGVCLYKTI